MIFKKFSLENKKARDLIPQAITVIALLSVIIYFATNAQINMGNRGISFGFGFLNQEASFDITFSMIEYDGSHSYGRAFLVGLLNTILVSVIGIFFATITLIIVNFLNKIFKEKNFKNALIYWYNQTVVGFEKGALNMVSVGIAIATAGIIVGAVGSTGLSTNLIIVIESIAKDNVIILLFLTIILCLLLGMGLPTTANYVVVASLMATVLVDVGNASGFIFPLIAVHLFVFYFGLMADVTPPVGLASYAAAAISGGDPLRTGAQAFWYSLRTGILPIVFLFNSELLLIGIESIWHGLMVIATSLIGILVFTSATQGWFINKLRWYEIVIFLIISISLLSPEFILNKFYPKYNYLSIEEINKKQFNYNKEIRIKITRLTEYGER